MLSMSKFAESEWYSCLFLLLVKRDARKNNANKATAPPTPAPITDPSVCLRCGGGGGGTVGTVRLPSNVVVVEEAVVVTLLLLLLPLLPPLLL